MFAPPGQHTTLKWTQTGLRPFVYNIVIIGSYIIRVPAWLVTLSAWSKVVEAGAGAGVDNSTLPPSVDTLCRHVTQADWVFAPLDSAAPNVSIL